MSRRNNQSGFSIVELLVVISLIGILSTIVFASFNSSINQYFSLQREGTNFTDLAGQSNRIANVLRGLYDIEAANQNEIVVYAYFFPNDQYASKVHYYKNTANTKLYADVTPMTANPPIGTPISSKIKTYTILDNYTKVANVNLFDYLSSTGTTLPAPITDLKTIKGIRVNLAVPAGIASKDQSVSVQVSLRNRKTNL